MICNFFVIAIKTQLLFDSFCEKGAFLTFTPLSDRRYIFMQSELKEIPAKKYKNR